MGIREETKKALATYRGAWVELGRLLNEVVYGGDYKEWGYDDFEVYCARELGLKKPTVQKLMVSYNYMRKHQAGKLEALEKGECVIFPSHDTLALLDKAERAEGVPERDLNELRFQAFSGDISDDTHKEFRSRLAPKREVDPDEAEKAKVMRLSRSLRRAMSTTHFVPDGLKERIEGPLVELEALD